VFVFSKVLHFPKFNSSLKEEPPHIKRLSPIIDVTRLTEHKVNVRELSGYTNQAMGWTIQCVVVRFSADVNGPAFL